MRLREIVKNFCQDDERLFRVLIGEQAGTQRDREIFNQPEIAQSFILVFSKEGLEFDEIQNEKTRELISKLQTDHDVLAFIPHMISHMEELLDKIQVEMPEIRLAN